MARDIHLSRSALHHPSFARLPKNLRFSVLQLMSICDDYGRLTWRADQIAWLLKISLERWNALRQRLIDVGLLSSLNGDYYLAQLLFASDWVSGIHISAQAFYNPCLARLKKNQRYDVVLLMSACDGDGRLTWSADQYAWLVKRSVARWMALEGLLIEETVILPADAVDAPKSLSTWLFVDGGDEEDEDDMLAAAVPTPETYGQEKPRKPSDTPYARAVRKQNSRARRKERESGGGVTSADVTPPVTPENGSGVTPVPSYTRAVTDSERTIETELPRNVGNGLRPEATDRDKSRLEKSGSGKWRQQNLDFARQSSELIGDQKSLGFHILCWKHARIWDGRRKNEDLLNTLFALMRQCADEYKQSGKNQGKFWTMRALKIFESAGVPLTTKPGDASPEEIEEVKAALAHLEEPA